MDTRIKDLIEKMTLEEKISMLAGADMWHTVAIERLGIPAIKMTDGPHGNRTIDDDDPLHRLPATCYPTGVSMGASWNPDLIHRLGQALGEETKSKGCDILLGPCINIQRSPLAGRNFESFSEDPYLVSRIAVAYVGGVQSQGVGTSVKHFACNNSEFERFTISSQIGERVFREIYLPGFKATVQEC
ncbi:MAG: glycoside hydrolase family 3 N-terminal domain-containing protein, partial [Candidatus Adiutricales bacterium]